MKTLLMLNLFRVGNVHRGDETEQDMTVMNFLEYTRSWGPVIFLPVLRDGHTVAGPQSLLTAAPCLRIK